MLHLCHSWYYRKLLFSSCVGMCVREGQKWKHEAVTQPNLIPRWPEASVQSKTMRSSVSTELSPICAGWAPLWGMITSPNIPALPSLWSPLSCTGYKTWDLHPLLSSQRSKLSAQSPKVIRQSPRGENWCNTFPEHLKRHNRPLLAMDITYTEYTRAEM